MSRSIEEITGELIEQLEVLRYEGLDDEPDADTRKIIDLMDELRGVIT